METIIGNLGKKIKRVRNSKGMTIKNVADELQTTKSFISQIENNKVMPSIKTLAMMSRVLDTPISAFFEIEEDNNHPIIKKAERQKLQTKDGVTYSLITKSIEKHKFEVLVNTYEKNGSTGFLHSHVGEEFGLVLKGKLKVEIEESEYILEKDDAIYLDSSKPHKITNVSEGESITIWINCPPSW